MANPQVENGHTQIANEILEQLIKMHLAPNQWQVLLCVIRKTYGWHKKEDFVSINQLAQATNLSRRSVIYTIQNLEAKKMILVNRTESNINSIKIQKNYELWISDALSEQYTKLLKQQKNKYHSIVQRNEPIFALGEVVQRNDESSAKNNQKVVQRNDEKGQFFAPTKETITKETITKETIQKKNIYGEFKNVFLTPDEYKKLTDRFGLPEALRRIDNLSSYMASRRKKYDSHYATILNWSRMDEKRNFSFHPVPKPNLARPPGRLPTEDEYDEMERQLKQGGDDDSR